MESVARRAGVSTKTLYRLIPNKAALFEAMITNRIDTFASVVRVRACDGSNIKGALREALVIWGELILDGEVIALQRLILADGEKFPEIAETFYHKAIQRTERTLANWLQAQSERGFIKIDDAETSAGMLLGMLVMALAFWMYSIAVMLMRLRSIILERERNSDWVKELKERQP